MRLDELVKKALGQEITSSVYVTGIAQDHRHIEQGYIFVARKGQLSDGHQFAQLAVDKGAIALVGQAFTKSSYLGVPYIHVRDDKRALASLAATFYRHPSKALMSYGVTGTDGKTTTSFLLHYLLSLKHKTGLLSTAGIQIARESLSLEGHFTTPEATEVQRLLALFRDQKCSHCVIESSSHGFGQHRLDHVDYDVGIWTNLSPEHLDFHKTFEAYREAKLTLVRRARFNILNRDDPSFEMFQEAAIRSQSYGSHVDSDWRAEDIQAHAGAQTFTLQHKEDTFKVKLPMLGSYNVHNALAALAAACSAGIELEHAIEHLERFPGVPGRMQLIQSEPFTLIVDFAHTAPALEKVLKTLRATTQARLITLIGAAGERDTAKRPLLAQVALTHGDLAIFTEEDSRSEGIGDILADMVKGAKQAGGKENVSYWCVEDRRKAIKFALEKAQRGDIVILSGKGHEDTLERKHETLKWNEVAEAKEALEALKGF